MARLVLWVLVGLAGCDSPTTKQEPRGDKQLPGDDQAVEAARYVPPSPAVFRALVADHLQLTRVYPPDLYSGVWLTKGFLVCTTARSRGAVHVGLRDPRDPSSAGWVTVQIQPRGSVREVRMGGNVFVVDVDDELCLLTPLSDHPWEWFRPDPSDRPERAPGVDLGPLRPKDSPVFERAQRLAPMFVDPRRIRMGDQKGFSQVRLTAAEEGATRFGAPVDVTAARAERIRVHAVVAPPPHASFHGVSLRPGDTLTLSRTWLEPGVPIPALPGL